MRKNEGKIFSASLWNKSSRATRRNNLQEHKRILHLYFLRRTPFLTQCMASIHRWGDQTLNRIQNASTDLSLSAGQCPQSTYAHKPAAFEIHFFNWPRHRLDAYASLQEWKKCPNSDKWRRGTCLCAVDYFSIIARKKHIPPSTRSPLCCVCTIHWRAQQQPRKKKNTRNSAVVWITDFQCAGNLLMIKNI